ncbi:Transcription initiation factor TFIID subunit 8 [Pseudozyma hubeiensis]|nr:Transcription initiation factor TFIID subunit 8 [Pseudozyma hubeiensis]
MPAGSVPSWAMTSSSAKLFGDGDTKANNRAAADAQLASSSDKTASSSAASQQQQVSTESTSRPVTAIDYASGQAAADAEHEKPYQPKRKQKPTTHCPPLTSIASSSRVPYSIPHIDEPSANEALFQLIAVQAKRAGFDATTSSALHEVSQLAKKFLSSVFSAATHAAELSSRDQPSARDLIYALETHGQPIRELRDFHRQQPVDVADETSKARAKAKEHASAPKTYTARIRAPRRTRDTGSVQEENEDWTQASDAFLPSDSDDGSEMDAWSVSSDSDDEHGNRRAAVHARVMKRKHDNARALAKQQRRQEKLRQPSSGEQSNSTSSSSARDLRALTSGEQAWRRVADHVVPRHLPGMPPRHAWMQTPAYPTNAYGSLVGGVGDAEEEASNGKRDPLVLVNRKLANARLVEASLRKLIQNTDGAAASAYASSSTHDVAANTTSSADQAASATAGKEASPTSSAPPLSTSAVASASGGFAVPKTPASGASGSGLTLRLNRKISLPASAFNSPTQTQPSTPIASRRASTVMGVGGAASASGAPGTPIGMGMSMGWGGEPLMSPLTPASAGPGGFATPYPPTPVGAYGQYFGSGVNAVSGAGASGYRSRSQSIVAAHGDVYGGASTGPGDGTGATAPDQLGVRLPGAVNYKNVWYAPGSTIASGGLAASGASAKSTGNHPRSVKRMRKWKV